MIQLILIIAFSLAVAMMSMIHPAIGLIFLVCCLTAAAVIDG